MTEKEIRKLSKKDMLELLLQQSKIIKELKEENLQLKNKLNEQEIMFKKSELVEILDALKNDVCKEIRNTTEKSPRNRRKN